MTVTAQASLESLAGELRNDAKAAGEKANHLSGWVDRETTDQEIYIPSGLLMHFYGALESFARRAVGSAR